MAYRSLDEFLIRLEHAKELIHIKSPIHDCQEIPQIIRDHAPHALWLDDVQGISMPIIVNLLGSDQRIAWALGVDSLNTLTDKVDELIGLNTPLTFSTMMTRAGVIMKAIRSMNYLRPREIPVQTVRHTENPSLSVLPMVRLYEQETHASFSYAQVISADSRRQRSHLSKVVVLDEHTIGIERRHLSKSTEAKVPTAIVIGADPVAMWSAGTSLPSPISPYWLAGWLRSKALSFSKALTQPIDILTDAEIVIEGYAEPDQEVGGVTLMTEGGFLNNQTRFVPMRVTAITHRQNPILPVQVPIALSDERTNLHEAMGKLFLPIIKMLVDGVVDFYQPRCSIGHNLLIIQCQDTQKQTVSKAIHMLWGLHGLSYNKAIIAVDESVNIYDMSSVIQAVMARVDWRDALIVQGGVHSDDNSGATWGYTGKIAIDATRPRAGFTPDQTPAFNPDHMAGEWRIWDNVAVGWVHDGVDIPAIRHDNPNHHLILLQDHFPLDDLETIAWYVLASVDWSRDMMQSETGYLTIVVRPNTAFDRGVI
jgi:4-hydroxy-3-polyprenylbenzoate decarboxylase